MKKAVILLLLVVLSIQLNAQQSTFKSGLYTIEEFMAEFNGRTPRHFTWKTSIKQGEEYIIVIETTKLTNPINPTSFRISKEEEIIESRIHKSQFSNYWAYIWCPKETGEYKIEVITGDITNRTTVFVR